jgi:hypothetical protein
MADLDFQWIYGRLAQWGTSFSRMGNALFDHWDYVTCPLASRDGFNMPHCRRPIPLDSNICAC